MPKMKSKSAVSKRFRLTASGKVKMNRSGRRHLMESKNRKKKMNMGKGQYVHETQSGQLARLLEV